MANRRAQLIFKHLKFDIRKQDTLLDDLDKAKIVFCYGVSPTHNAWFRQHQQKKRFIFIDLGYWNRGGQLSENASYKFSMDYWHPQKWLNTLELDDKRFKKSGLQIRS